MIEIISVLIILGIIGAVIGPFIGNVLGNYIQGRELVERERQASLILERFVRDVRMSAASDLNIDSSCSSSQTLYKNNSNENVTYKLVESSLFYEKNDEYLLSKYIDNVCFRVQNATSKFNIVSIEIELRVSNDNVLKYKASAVPR